MQITTKRAQPASPATAKLTMTVDTRELILSFSRLLKNSEGNRDGE